MDLTNRDDVGALWENDMLLLENQNDFFSESPSSLDDVRNRVPLDMVDGFMVLEDYENYCDPSRFTTSTSTQTTSQSTRKIKPVNNPALKLKTPIAFQKDTDPSAIPIQKDGMAVCEQCGAIGVKHSFYTKERRFCSMACSREYAEAEKSATVTAAKRETQIPVSEDSSEQSSGLEEVPDTPGASTTEGVASSYDWGKQLSESGFIAAPVSFFKHVLASDCWDNVTVGMKVEVENTDCDDFSEDFPETFWVATVLKIAGYYALLRYEGFGQNKSKDFWLNMCIASVHPVGWCATRGKPLIPPKTIEHKYKDWKEFLVKRLTGARTLPSNFFSKVSESQNSRFRCGLSLEVVDKDRLSCARVGRITNIIGKRLHIAYYGDNGVEKDFWCHENSSYIHPVGWSQRVGHLIVAPEEYIERCDQGKLHPDDATDACFIQLPEILCSTHQFEEGMKLEAVDPVTLSGIFVSTVMKVLSEGYLMIQIDLYESDEYELGCFCCHSTSPYIFPAGFCEKNALTLVPPKGYNQGAFNWNSYIQDTKTVPAPQALFTKEVPSHDFLIGMRLETTDIADPFFMCVGTVSCIVGRLLKIHLDGKDEECDQWLDCKSPDIYPVGWCQLVGQKLQGPADNPPTTSSNKGKSLHDKRSHRRVHRRRRVSSDSPPTKKNGHVTFSEAVGSDVNFCPESSNANFSTNLEARDISEDIPWNANVNAEAVEEFIVPDLAVPYDYSYVETAQASSTTGGSKLIPRLVDTFSVSEPRELIPSEWSVSDVAQFLKVNDCGAYCESFSSKNIDGERLLSLTKDQIVDLTGMKVGPSLKIYDLIQQLRIKINPAQERMKLSLRNFCDVREKFY